MLLITGVGSLIHIFAVGYMDHDPERRRLNRVGDAALSLAIMVMFATFGTLTFSGVFRGAPGAGSVVVTALGLLMLVGACAKSAQVLLQAWLVDAMECPTPVSALIHAATMVTAGVYLIVRSAVFNLASDAQLAVAAVGAVTLLFGAVIGCAKDDIKKSLAGSTMSQIGYMVLAAGLGPAGYAFAIALLAHGFFKAELFLTAGSVKHEMDDEVDMRRFGGMARSCRSPVRRCVPRVGADAARPVAHPAVGVLRQPRRGRPGERSMSELRRTTRRRARGKT